MRTRQVWMMPIIFALLSGGLAWGQPAASGPASAPVGRTSPPATDLGVVRPQALYTKNSIAVPFFDIEPGLALEWESLSRVIRRDLELSGLFTLPDSQMVNRLNRADVEKKTPQWDRWVAAGVDFYLMAQCKKGAGADGLSVQTVLYDVRSQVIIFHKMFQGTVSGHRMVAHQISDEVLKTVKGISPGICQTQIAYVTDRSGRNLKELAVMDFDGFGQNQPPLTRYAKLVTSPAWGAQGREVYFTSYHQYNSDLFGIRLSDKYTWPITRFPGLNSMAEWSEVAQRLVLTLSKDGNSELYTAGREGAGLRRLTTTKTIESSPTWSPDGRQIAFVSDRDTGTPQIFIMNADGSGVRRLTRQGSWNDAPAWSPKGDRIAFVSRVSGSFDIFTCDVTGDNSSWRRLTMNQGRNENPSWSPSGTHLAFASNRTGTWHVYLMLDDGSNQMQLTTMGANSQPTWGPAPAGAK